ncbi:hypothetical protein ACP70R_037317 [Stipagrostis hirtigluma subsp. patula]
MFYSHAILARKSPLGTVWIAAHLERKIKKPQIDGIHIPSYAESIMFPEVPIALRLSGHLLLGIVRIYSWKVNYLFQDCNRMLTTIKTAFASVQVDLSLEAGFAPFEDITLPPTLNLDDFDLSDAICHINTPDNHQKTADQITLADDGEYVTVDLDDEDVRVEPSVLVLSSFKGPEPIEEETFPPFGDGFGEINETNDEMPPTPRNLPVNSTENQEDGGQDPPEKMREASQETPGLNFIESIIGNDDPMEMNQDSSLFVQNKVITPPTVEISSTGQQITGRSVPNIRTQTTCDAFEDYAPQNSDNHFPEWRINPCSPQVQDERNMRPKAQENKRKRKIEFDYIIVLSSDYMKDQIDGIGLDELVCKRRKLPETALDMWRFSKTNSRGNFLLDLVLHGTCTNLHAIYERNFPLVSDTGVECASGEPASGSQDAPPEWQLTPNSPVNVDAPPECQLYPTSLGNADTQPEPLLTPMSLREAGAAQDEDMLPDLPRLSPVDMPSPIRVVDDSPFKTPGQTPRSGLGGTGITEIPPSDGSYLLPGQSTRDSDPLASLFPIYDDHDDQPEIPGLVSTPGGLSIAGTGASGLGSMSARTRAVAQFFKDQMPSASSDGQPGKFSLNSILEGRVRKQGARMFFETMVLKSYDYIDAQQEEPYGDIEISVKPSLAAAKL